MGIRLRKPLLEKYGWLLFYSVMVLAACQPMAAQSEPAQIVKETQPPEEVTRPADPAPTSTRHAVEDTDNTDTCTSPGEVKRFKLDRN